MLRVRSARDFWAGIIYIIIGAGALFMAQRYALGTLQRMGPGYFPTILGGLMLLFGVISLVRSFAVTGPLVAPIAWKALVLVIGSSALFALLLPRAGLVIASVLTGLMSAAASRWFAFDVRALAGLLVLAAACALVFVTTLQVPMPIWGRWFGY
ncbi:tripartite tricarboxylate transporter TctB family protein [Leptospira interrogans]